MNAVFQNRLHARVREDDLAGGLLNVATAQAIHGFGITVRNLVDVSVAPPATDARVGAAIEEGFIHVEEPIGTFLINAGKTPEAVAHETVVCVHGVQSLRRCNSE
jgi:hypothetical protein